jgi:hypothetical protein
LSFIEHKIKKSNKKNKHIHILFFTIFYSCTPIIINLQITEIQNNPNTLNIYEKSQINMEKLLGIQEHVGKFLSYWNSGNVWVSRTTVTGGPSAHTPSAVKTRKPVDDE